jgi:hypothetical protein
MARVSLGTRPLPRIYRGSSGLEGSGSPGGARSTGTVEQEKRRARRAIFGKAYSRFFMELLSVKSVPNQRKNP